ncbi:MAG: hypothetical protein KF873_07720 [Gemmataceae bacterium]|nr:hypothetical protein [Planctomycetia bacterium]MBX3398610.1 hypothetical protein [Gemmataceae bacterium]
MIAKVLNARVGSDGVLRLEVPMGEALAGEKVEVAVAEYRVPETDEEKRAVIRSLAGAWQGEFERPPQGELQDRDPL